MDGINTAPVPTSDEKTMATLAHILQVVAWWIAPLIIFLTKRDSKFVSFHALQALLWQLVLLVVWMVGFCGWFVLMFATIFSTAMKPIHDQTPPVAFFVVFPLFWLFLMGIWMLNLVLAIVYGIKASRGEWAGYPVIGRWARNFVETH